MSKDVAGHCSVIMLGRWALVSGVVVGVAACGTVPATRLPSEAAEGAAVRAPIARLQQQPFLVWGNLVDLVQQSDELEITQLDEEAGYIVARYSGDPEPYVSCGSAPGNLEPVATAAPAASGAPVNATNGAFRLDGRLMVQIEADGPDTLVTTRSTYVLTRFAGGAQADGARRGHEIISFGTGGQGEFAGGLVCQPTGHFERVVLSGLPDPTVAGRREQEPVSPSGAAEAVAASLETAVADLPCADVEPQFAGDAVRLSGYVASEEDAARLRQAVEQVAGGGSIDTAALEVRPWPFCEVLQITEPYLEANRQNGAGLDVALADGGGEILSEGEPLALEVDLPAGANYLYLGYIQQDGRVGHIGTMAAREWATTTGRVRYDTGLEVAEPFGREMILAIGSERPLFQEARPAFEAPEQFVQALRQELSDLAATDPDQTIIASHLFITTQGNDVR